MFIGFWICFLTSIIKQFTEDQTTKNMQNNHEDHETEIIEHSDFEENKHHSMLFDPHSSTPTLNPLDSGSEDYRFSTGIMKIKNFIFMVLSKKLTLLTFFFLFEFISFLFILLCALAKYSAFSSK